MGMLLRMAWLFGALGLFVGPVGAQEAGAPATGKKITVEFKGAPFRQALDQLFRATGFDFIVDEDLPNVPVHVAFANEEDLETALLR